MVSSGIIKKLFILGLFACSAPIFAKPSLNAPQLLEGHNRSIGTKFYITAGWHDGGRKLGFFFPGIWHNADSQVWWDTGIIIKGSGIGYRKMFSSNHFVGGYVYYDVMRLWEWFSPVRLNIGGEWSSAHWGALTVSGYGALVDSAYPQPVYDRAGISAKLSADTLLTSFKPFIAGSYSWVKFKNDDKTSCVPSVAVGMKWIVSHAVEFEIKRIWDQYQFPLHAGFQVRWDGMNPKSNYFKHRFNRPPDRYIPYYANASSFIPKQRQLDSSKQKTVSVWSDSQGKFSRRSVEEDKLRAFPRVVFSNYRPPTVEDASDSDERTSFSDSDVDSLIENSVEREKY